MFQFLTEIFWLRTKIIQQVIRNNRSKFLYGKHWQFTLIGSYIAKKMFQFLNKYFDWEPKKIQQVIKNDCLFNNCLSNKLSETIAYIVLAVNSYMGNTILLRWLVLTMLKSFQFLNKYFDWEPKKNPTRYQKQLPIQQLPIQQVIKNNCLYWARSSEFLCGKHNLATLIGSYNAKKWFKS
jgi:hypothetical protein